MGKKRRWRRGPCGRRPPRKRSSPIPMTTRSPATSPRRTSTSMRGWSRTRAPSSRPSLSPRRITRAPPIACANWAGGRRPSAPRRRGPSRCGRCPSTTIWPRSWRRGWAAEVAAGLPDDAQPLDGDVLDTFQVPAQEVLGEFRAKLRQTVRPEDVQTHYDLGIAYKEMGLIEEAIGEFEQALEYGGGTRAVDCISMLGTCEMERSRPADAIERFRRGLALSDLSGEARCALAFGLGAALESLGQNDEALEQYEAVVREDPKFRDVEARMTSLGGSLSRPAARAKARVSRAAPAKSAAPAIAAKGAPRPTGSSMSPAGRKAATSTAGTGPPEPPQPARKNRKIGFF